MAHICIQRFNTGNGKHYRAQRHKRHHFIFQEEMHRPHWVQRVQDIRVGNNTA
ncbi:Uncharacterised protein [Enterobacter cloacae]|nr:Uncharacterised protein [Enterobacter cloacae]